MILFTVLRPPQEFVSSPTLWWSNFAVVRLCLFYLSAVKLVVIRLCYGLSYLIKELPFGTPLFVSHCDISLILMTPDRLIKARIPLPVIKLNVSFPEEDDNKCTAPPFCHCARSGVWHSLPDLWQSVGLPVSLSRTNTLAKGVRRSMFFASQGQVCESAFASVRLISYMRSTAD
jgi:hypothetical protein